MILEHKFLRGPKEVRILRKGKAELKFEFKTS